MKITIKGVEFVVPKWTKWVAQDKNGHWYAYAMEPHLRACEWDSHPKDDECDRINPIAKDWKKSLIEVN